MQPRPYQQAAIDAAERMFGDHNRLLGILPTGGGKTIVFSFIAKRRQERGQRTLILAHREELIDQAIAKLHTATGIVAEKEKAEFCASRRAQVVVASVQTMIRRLDDWPADHFGLVVCDEAHHSISPMWQKVLAHFKAAQVLGVTATPDRGDARNLGEFYQAIAFEQPVFTRDGIPGLVNLGYLSPIVVKSIPIDVDLSAVSSSKGDFDEGDLGAALEPYLDRIAASLLDHAAFRRILAFLPLKITSQKFVDACRNVGLMAEHVDGESQDRAEKLQRFARGEFDLLSNAMLLTEGYDDPGIDCILNLRITRSRSLYAQIVGRGTRIAPGKENLLLLDYLWSHQKHKLCRPAHLVAKDELEAEIITKNTQKKAAMPGDVADQMPLDLQGLATDCQAQREEALRKQLEENRKKKGKYISAEEFALEHHNTGLAEYQPVGNWERGPVTEDQHKALKRAGIAPETVSCRGQAREILTVHNQSKPLRLADAKSVAMINRLPHIARRAGIHDFTNVTQAQAGRFWAALKANKK